MRHRQGQPTIIRRLRFIYLKVPGIHVVIFTHDARTNPHLDNDCTTYIIISYATHTEMCNQRQVDPHLKNSLES